LDFSSPLIGFILALLVPLCERACVFASCSQIPLTQTAPSHCRSANLEFSTAPTTDLTRAPTSWGLAVGLFRSRRIDHPAVRIPGIILEAVTTSVFPTCGAIPPTPPFVILYIALTCFRHSYLLFKIAHRPYMYRRIVQDVIVPTMFFFLTLEFTVL